MNACKFFEYIFIYVTHTYNFIARSNAELQKNRLREKKSEIYTD